MKHVFAVSVAAVLTLSASLAFGDQGKDTKKIDNKPTRLTVVTSWKAEKVTLPDGTTEFLIVVDPLKRLNKPEELELPVTARFEIRGGGSKQSDSAGHRTIEVIGAPTKPLAVREVGPCNLVVTSQGNYCSGGSCPSGTYCKHWYQDQQLMCGCNKVK